MIWTKGEIQYYVDSPTTGIYATYKSTDSAWTPTAWPFDAGPEFIILNLAVGGDWPGDVNSSTVLPSTMQVQYVRIYAN
jgi:beta-glucanase (GH16 family)